MNALRPLCLSTLLLFLSSLGVLAGGSGLNVIVVVNTTSTNSLQLGNYFCERRQVPPNNVLRITWTNSGPATEWAVTDFTNALLIPLGSMLASRQLTNQANFLLLSMDIPYRVNNANVDYDSTTSALFYGFKTNDPSVNPPGCSLPAGSTNLYAASEMPFRSIAPGSQSWSNLLTTMITDNSDVNLAQTVVDQGVNSDSTFPTQTVLLAKSTDVLRNIRYWTFDNAIFNTRLRGNSSMQRIVDNNDWDLGTILGVQSGVYSTSVSPSVLVPGTMADNLTSYGGDLFESTGGQMDILLFIGAGASGTYGTVVEPCAELNKFPSPMDYFYQARGFSLAECYMMSLTNPFEGLLLGEPLAAPFASPAQGHWNNLPANALLSSTTNLSLQFSASDAQHPLQKADLFVDGLWVQTLTNIPPWTNNVLSVTLNGFQTNYTVPAGATLASIVSNLSARLNVNSYSNLTKISSSPHGDRLELHSTVTSRTASQLSLSVASSIGSASALTTFLNPNATGFLDTAAFGIHNLVVSPPNPLSPPPATGSWLLLTVTKTNGTVVKVGSTNTGSFNTIPLMVQNLVNMIGTNAQLTTPDGCTAQDFIDYGAAYGISPPPAEFNLLPQSAGWAAAQMQAVLTGSSAVYFSISPSGTHPLEDNLPDLQPRAHLYATAGVTNLAFSFPFNTTGYADGYHDLCVVAYEGSHVQTQARAAQTVLIQNTPLSATLKTLAGASNALVSMTLVFSVTANTNTISKIELFSTGGSLGSVSGQSSATFSVQGSYLGVGQHPFYAVVTANSGKQYRTGTTWIQLVSVPPFVEPSFSVTITSPPPTLSWPATAGRSYDILTVGSLTNSFQLNSSTVPTNSPARWVDTNAPAYQRFYKVRTSN